MSVKKWGMLEDHRIINIDSIPLDERESYKGKVFCCGCGSPLILRMGEKNDWYFCHPTGEKESCKEASTKVIRDLFVQVVMSAPSIVVPDSKSVAGGFFTLKGGTIDLTDAKILQTSSGVFFHSGDHKYFIDCWTGGALRKHVCDVPHVVIRVDMRSFIKRLDLVTYDALRGYILGESAGKCIISSNELEYYTKKYNDALYTYTGDMTICPAMSQGDDNPKLVDTKSCKKCIFHVKHGVCYGRGCFGNPMQDLFDDRTAFERYEEYFSGVPEPVGYVVRYRKHPFGTCSNCGTKLEIQEGASGVRISGVPKLSTSETAFAYLVCPKCGQVQEIRCPECNTQMLIRRNKRSGKIYLVCPNYDLSDNVTEDSCNRDLSTLTLFTHEPATDNYADELQAVDTIQDFMKGGKRVVSKLRAVRGKS